MPPPLDTPRGAEITAGKEKKTQLDVVSIDLTFIEYNCEVH